MEQCGLQPLRNAFSRSITPARIFPQPPRLLGPTLRSINSGQQRQGQILGCGGTAPWGLLEGRVASVERVLGLEAIEDLLDGENLQPRMDGAAGDSNRNSAQFCRLFPPSGAQSNQVSRKPLDGKTILIFAIEPHAALSLEKTLGPSRKTSPASLKKAKKNGKYPHPPGTFLPT